MAFQTLSPGTLLSPVPAVMVSCALPGKRPNVITVAWAGTVCSDPPMLSISVRKERFSHGRLLKGNGGAQRFVQHGRKSCSECKRRNEPNCDTDGWSSNESWS